MVIVTLRLRNDLDCVGRGVKLYSLSHGNSNTWVIWQCHGRNGKTERSRVVVWKPRVTAQMWLWRGRSFQTVAQDTGNARLPTVERRTGGTSRRCEVRGPQPSPGCHVGKGKGGIEGPSRFWNMGTPVIWDDLLLGRHRVSPSAEAQCSARNHTICVWVCLLNWARCFVHVVVTGINWCCICTNGRSLCGCSFWRWRVLGVSAEGETIPPFPSPFLPSSWPTRWLLVGCLVGYRWVSCGTTQQY